MKTIRIAPSILASDWSKLGEEVKAIEAAGADLLHLDVMDGHFVPPITFGPGVVEAIRRSTKLPLDVHLMIERPESKIEAFAKAGADNITVQFEACTHLHRVIELIHQQGKTAGVAINPATPVGLLEDVIGLIDLLLVMSVNPGWGGQQYIEHTDAKLAEATQLIHKSGRSIALEVDGGIDAQTGKRAVKAGADTLVTGTFVFKHGSYKEAIALLRKTSA